MGAPQEINPRTLSLGRCCAIVNVGRSTVYRFDRDGPGRGMWQRGRRDRPPDPYVEFVHRSAPQYAAVDCWAA